MVERFQRVDPSASADAITKEYVEVTVAEALDDLRTPGAGEFFGRITEEPAHTPPRYADTWYIGRRHIEDADHAPVVVDWRAPIAAGFYRATGVDPLGLAHRRRYTLAADEGGINRITALLDEQLDDPDASGSSGIPDPVLAEIGAARTGAMREIVATIQGEQDVVIRGDINQCLVVQGGPGTGKTAVGLHRAAYLLFEHRRRLNRDGVLVVGPNPVFLDYIANVLPSLGERTVRQATVLDLCVPKVDITAIDSTTDAAWKGSADRLADLEQLVRRAIQPPTAAVRCAVGARTIIIEADEIAEWIDAALTSAQPINKRRDSLRGIVTQALLRRTGRDDLWTAVPELRAALNSAWPTQKAVTVVDRWLPGPSGKRRRWTGADQLLVDEANSLLVGAPFTFGHVVVDEAQDHSAVGLRVIGRRSPSGSLTVLGDLAQSSTPAGQRSWDEALRWLIGDDVAGMVAHLTIGYRVPAPILDVANRLLSYTGVDAQPSRSVRMDGAEPDVVSAATDAVAETVADQVGALRRRHRNLGVIAPMPWHDRIGAALTAIEMRLATRVQHLDPDEIPVFTAEAAKGLEFDAVVIVNPHEILSDAGDTERGARLLYVAITRAVQVVSFVTDAPIPAVLGIVKSPRRLHSRRDEP
jgi:DNA helicase IV